MLEAQLVLMSFGWWPLNVFAIACWWGKARNAGEPITSTPSVVS